MPNVKNNEGRRDTKRRHNKAWKGRNMEKGNNNNGEGALRRHIWRANMKKGHLEKGHREGGLL